MFLPSVSSGCASYNTGGVRVFALSYHLSGMCPPCGSLAPVQWMGLGEKYYKSTTDGRQKHDGSSAYAKDIQQVLFLSREHPSQYAEAAAVA